MVVSSNELIIEESRVSSVIILFVGKWFKLWSWWLKEDGLFAMVLIVEGAWFSSVMVVIGWLNSEEVKCWW